MLAEAWKRAPASTITAMGLGMARLASGNAKGAEDVCVR